MWDLNSLQKFNRVFQHIWWKFLHVLLWFFLFSIIEKAKADAEKAPPPELEKYWKAVKDKPTDFTGWTYLLQYVEQQVRGKIVAESLYLGSGLYAAFWKGKGTKASSSWERAPYKEIVNFYWIMSTRAPRQWPRGHGGNRLCCLREVSGLRFERMFKEFYFLWPLSLPLFDLTWAKMTCDLTWPQEKWLGYNSALKHWVTCRLFVSSVTLGSYAISEEGLWCFPRSLSVLLWILEEVRRYGTKEGQWHREGTRGRFKISR